MIKRDEHGWHVNVDLVFLYLIAFVAVVVVAIKAIRWAVTS